MVNSTVPVLVLASGDEVLHGKFGQGIIEFSKDESVIVRFVHGLEECSLSSLVKLVTLGSAISKGEYHPPAQVITRAQAACIQSANDAWGVFSRSRINLLPHQLWVCNQVLKKWPARYMVADDVGLGKTIEAGLMLWPLLSKGLVKRVLILCPASLVEQWQFRLRDMFDIRLTRYSTEADTPKSDFWNTHSQVVASLPTLRADNKGRHQRMLEAEPWDLLIVDEAHHLNTEEKSEPTQGFQLVESLLEKEQVESCIFFTGTPHRGKSWGFWALMNLLRPDLFDPKKSDEEQIVHLREALIRNNKSLVTDMQGNKLFKPVSVYSEVYSYSPEEAQFYQLLSEFITGGKAYATSLSSQGGRQVMLVLIAMQKLASSSVAAIGKTLRQRLMRLRASTADIYSGIQSSIDDADILLDGEEKLEVELAKFMMAIMEHEMPHLEALVEAADQVPEDTKILRILEVLEERFKGRTVLFFTEYKTTQAALMSALMKQYGEDCVTFINGDERLEQVQLPNGRFGTRSIGRADAADQFNEGKVRFLISTEAGGEGIDLQHRCYSLIHVDLPWNPMRLHQRVGRLNRYGQTHAVDVVTIRNPDTVESRIWDKLNDKLERITEALGSAMDDPEDLLQLVLGMSSSSVFTELFSEAQSVNDDRLDSWFDDKATTFGGETAIDTIKSMVGHTSRFDLQGLKDIPQIDLPALRPFFESMLKLASRRVSREGNSIAFKTPDAWLSLPGVRRRYEGLVFSREVTGRDASEMVIGVGHRAFDQAMQQAQAQQVSLCYLPEAEDSLILFQIYDQITEKSGHIREAVAAVKFKMNEPSENWEVLGDWRVIDWLNELKSEAEEDQTVAGDVSEMAAQLEQASTFLEQNMAALGLPFLKPAIRPVLLLKGS
ncbi:MAG: DEAD/DEAH box helicase [Motiliproteus sp.]